LSWQAIYGEPATELPWLPNDGTPALPQGTPFGIVGTSSVYHRNSQTNGLPLYNTIMQQGGDVGTFDNSQIHAIRIVQTEPQSHLSYKRDGGSFLAGDKGWTNDINERLRILGEVPLRKYDAEGKSILDPWGDPDTSFAAKIPADVPFTFQLIDAKGKALVLAQTWHQVRPGEKRVNCGGCHAHAESPRDFAMTAAARPDYVMPSLLGQPREVEFTRDLLPILTAHGCIECHSNGAGQAAMDLSGNAYAEVAERALSTQSRLSKLIHKLEGVTESGGSITGERMPPGGPYLSDAEVRTVAEWIDLGAANGSGVFTDNLPPTLTVTHPAKDEAASEIVIGAFDNDSRLDVSTLKVQIGDGTAPLVDITTQFVETDNVWTYTLPQSMPAGDLHVEVYDNQGNVQRVVRHFNGTPPLPPDPDSPQATQAAQSSDGT
jgi:mono/diheme cytochrome c family protein